MKYFLITTILCVTIGCGQTPKKETTTDEIVTDVHEENVLVFSKTKVYRHKSIETGVDLIKKLGEENDFGVAHTEDASLFTPEKLSEYDVVLFLSTTGDVLNEEQQKAFKGYIQSGGSFMGIHAASDTEYEWPWYGKLVGGYFVDHPNNPNVRNADIQVFDKSQISTKHLPETWNRDDEWYNFKNLNPDVNVLLNLDETSYEGGTNGEHHPIAWYHEFDGGRAFYTGGGHTKESYSEPLFVQHVLGGIFYCLRR